VTAPELLAPSPWLQIWTRPRAAIRGVVDQGRLLAAVLLSVGSGVVQSLVTGANHQVGARFTAPVILLIAVGVGTLWGLFQLSLLAGLLYIVARWTGSAVPFRQLWTALGWANVPQCAALVLWLIGTLILGRSLYLDPEVVGATAPLSALLIGLVALATGICWIWWAVIVVKGVAEVHHVSAWAGLGHVLGAFAILMVAAIVLVPIAILMSR